MPTVTLVQTTPDPVRPGDLVSFDLVTSDDFPAYFGWSSQLTYNADEVSYLGTDFNDVLDINAQQSEMADAEGETTITGIEGGTFGTELSGRTVAGTLNFEAITGGNVSILLEPFGGAFFRAPPTTDIPAGPPVFDESVGVTFVVNSPPVAENDTGSGDQGSSILIDVLNNDTDADDGAVLTVVRIGNAANGSVTSAENGLTYTPNEGFAGNDSFEYDVSDGFEISTAVVNVVVNETGTTLVGMNDTASLDEDTSVETDVLLNDIGDDLQIGAFTDGANGTVTRTDGGLTYTPNANFNGADTYTYDVMDGDTVQTVAVDVTVAPVNDDPVADDDIAVVDEDGSVEVAVLAGDTDIDGDVLSISGFGQGSNGTVTETAGGLTYTPDPDFNGDDSFTYEVSDGAGGTDSATVDVTVRSVVDGPSDAGSVTLTPTVNGMPVTGFVRPGDTIGFELTTSSDFPGFIGFESSLTYDADRLSYTGTTFNEVFTQGSFPLVNEQAESPGASGVTTINQILAGIFTGELAGELTVGTYNFTALTAGDVNILVEGFNGFFLNDSGDIVFDTPIGSSVSINSLAVADNDTATLDEDASTTVDVLSNDSDADDGDTLTVTSVGQAQNGTVSLVDGTVTYTPDPDFNGADSFTYEVSDGKETVSATVGVTVNPQNDDPIVLDSSLSVDEDNAITIAAVAGASDIDGDALSVSAFGQGQNGDVTEQDGILTYTPDLNFNGMDSFTYTVSDGNGGEVQATVTLVINAVNDGPIAVADSAEVNEGESVQIDVLNNDTDVEGDPLMIASFADGANGVVSLSDGILTYEPNEGFFGTDTFAYTVSDGNGGVSEGTVSVTVLPVNDAPVAIGESVSVAEDASITVNVLENDSDSDGDTLSILAFEQGANGSVSEQNGNLVYTPNADFNGTDSFGYTVSDGNGGTADAVVDVTITPENDAPVLAVGDMFEIVEGADMPLFTASASDTDGDELSFSLSGADGFEIDQATGVVSFVSPPDFDLDGPNTFELNVEVSDGLEVDSQQVNVTVLLDTDGDMVADRDDNATFAFNPDQRDSNGDGFGNIIDGDLNNDNSIGLSDLQLLRSALGQIQVVDSVDDGFDAADADFNGDTQVDLADLRIFASLIGNPLNGTFSDDVA